MHSSQVADLGSVVERAGRGSGDLGALGVRRSEAATDVEVIDGGGRVVDGRGPALEHRLQVRAVVAHRPVPPLLAAERVAVQRGVRKPGEILADLGGIRAPGLLAERSGRRASGCCAQAGLS